MRIEKYSSLAMGAKNGFSQNHIALLFLFYFHDGNKIKKATQCDCALTICQRANHIVLLFYLISIMKVR